MSRARDRPAGWVLLLRLEGLVVLAGAVALFASLDGSWVLFGLLFLVPDVSMLGYLGGERVGARTYNAAHTYAAPAILAGVAWGLGAELPGQIALIWAGHIGFDRVLGYGLKLPTGFGDTHLGRIGKGG